MGPSLPEADAVLLCAIRQICNPYEVGTSPYYSAAFGQQLDEKVTRPTRNAVVVGCGVPPPGPSRAGNINIIMAKRRNVAWQQWRGSRGGARVAGRSTKVEGWVEASESMNQGACPFMHGLVPGVLCRIMSTGAELDSTSSCMFI